MLSEETNFLHKSSAELDAALSEIEFETLFLKCQLLADMSLANPKILSDVNDEVAAMELSASKIEAELKKRGEVRYHRRSFANFDNAVAIEEILKELPRTN